jgi:hypothetical protein
MGSEYFVVGSAVDGPALLAEAEQLNPRFAPKAPDLQQLNQDKLR